jgi:hypothetical protein
MAARKTASVELRATRRKVAGHTHRHSFGSLTYTASKCVNNLKSIVPIVRGATIVNTVADAYPNFVGA